MIRTIARPSAALIAIAFVGIAAPASAHVSVSSTDAARGGFGKVVFRVPTESETASTTSVVVTLPKGAPFAFVNAGAKPGWKVTIDKEQLDKPTKAGDFELTEAVRTITWTSTGEGIAPSQFDEFAISGGPFPEAEKITFTAQQTYSDGKVVQWDEVQTGDKEPEHPALTLTLAEPAGDPDHERPEQAEDDGTDPATWLAGAALAVAAAALVVALRENRRHA